MSNVIRFPSDSLSPKEALEEALTEVDAMQGVVILAISNTDIKGKELASIKVGGDHEFSDKDILWMIKRLEFIMMDATISMEDDANG